MKNIRKFSLWLLACFVFFATAQVACSSDDPPANNAGSGGSVAGSGGSAVGGNANGGSGNGGSAGELNGGWKKGVVGTSKGSVVLSKNAGRIQGFSITKPSMPTGGQKFMDLPLDAGDEGGAPDTTPKFDMNGINPDFSELWVPVSPYASGPNDEIKIAPEIAIIQAEGGVTTLHPFTDWPNEDFVWNCIGSYNINVNGNELRAYGGLSFDMTNCLGRHFLISNMSEKVWEIYPDGTRHVLVASLPGPSNILCDQGSLLITTLPQYESIDKAVAKIGVSLHRVNIDNGTVTKLFTIPPTPDYAGSETVPICGTYPGTNLGIPIGINIPFALKPSGGYLVADPGARTIYSISDDGTEINPFAPMERFTVSAILAPNDVIYSVEPPVIEWETNTIATGAVVKAYDGQTWTIVQELEGYELYAKNMSNQYVNVPCPANVNSTDCHQPTGGFIKVMPGAPPVLYLTDPIKGEMTAIPLDVGSGTGGASGAGGEAGSSGSGG